MSYCPCGATPLSDLGCQDQSSENAVPTCGKRCSKQLPCSTPGERHTCSSLCHTGPCPPCATRVEKMCVNGQHKMSYVPCYEDMTTCDEMCGKKLPCRHRCQEKCHRGDCMEKCKQPCKRKRKCSHACSVITCHYPEKCPPCNKTVTLTCKCGKQKRQVICSPLQGHEETLKCDSRFGCTAPMKLTASGRVYGGNYEDYVISQIELLIEKAEKLWDKSKSEHVEHAEMTFKTTSSYNRRIIHIRATDYGCTSESFGNEPNRYTVVSYKK